MVKSQPDILLDGYERLWNELNKDKDITRQKTYYENVRERFNGEHNPIDFLFLNRTCFNGLIRYNRKGEFNSPFHLNRPGIEPLKLKKILFEWSDLLNRNNVEFYWDSYHNINDFIYLDPPYANTKGMYNGEFDKDKFFQYVRDLKCGYALSYDGKSGDEDNTFNVPKDLYDEHMYLKSGKSSFKRIKEVVNDAMVYESLYVKKNEKRGNIR